MHRVTATAAFTAAIALTAGQPATASARTTLCEKAAPVRASVVHKHGRDAPGRDICRWGVVIKRGAHRGSTRPPTNHEKGSYLRQLKQLAAPPPPFLAKTVGPPPRRPAGTQTARVAATGLASCIVAHESGGNAQAVNGQYGGIAQWSPEAWRRHGGTRYAASPLGATKQQQLLVLSQGLSRYGCRDWCPYDGC